jgi:chemotaxis protein MotB
VAENQEQPIIVRRKKKGHGGSHGGAWKVAFADFMTAMMAFFLVMWLVGQKDEVKEAVAGYFRDPGKFMTPGGTAIMKGSKSPIKKLDDKSSGVMNKEEKSPQTRTTEEEKKVLSDAAKKIMEELRKQAVFGKLKNNIKIQLTSEGLRIILNESEDSPAFFEPGSAKLLQKSAIILITIAGELGHLQNRLVIEGHTDASFGGDRTYSNWELSADRANAARALMEVSGLRQSQVREVRGFAAQFPMIVGNPNDARNRRVSLVVLYQSKEAQYDELAVGADLMSEIL